MISVTKRCYKKLPIFPICPKSIYYESVAFQIAPKSPNVWATFERKFDAKLLSKIANLVTLDGTRIEVLQNRSRPAFGNNGTRMFSEIKNEKCNSG